MTAEAPGATRGEMACWLAAMFAAGSILSILSLVVPHGPHVNGAWTWGTSIAAFPIAGAMYLAAGRMRIWMLHGALALATAMVSVGIHNAGGGRLAGSAGVFYLWVAIYAAYFFSPRAVAAHLAFVVACYATTLAAEHEHAGPALLLGMTGTAVVTAVVIASAARRLRVLASTDPLTGLPNRLGWEVSLDRELARSARRGTPLCVAVLDLDDFKPYNDEHGHLAGDRMLKFTAAAWLGLLRESDVLARYGGDEFGVILPDCPLAKAGEIMERLVSANPASATCSVGVALALPNDDAATLIERADRALYEAKASGGRKGKVVTAS